MPYTFSPISADNVYVCTYRVGNICHAASDFPPLGSLNGRDTCTGGDPKTSRSFQFSRSILATSAIACSFRISSSRALRRLSSASTWLSLDSSKSSKLVGEAPTKKSMSSVSPMKSPKASHYSDYQYNNSVIQVREYPEGRSNAGADYSRLPGLSELLGLTRKARP